MKLIAERQLLGDYGKVSAGEQFEVSADVGEQLIARGLARHALPPRVLYEVRGGKFVSETKEENEYGKHNA